MQHAASSRVTYPFFVDVREQVFCRLVQRVCGKKAGTLWQVKMSDTSSDDDDDALARAPPAAGQLRHAHRTTREAVGKPAIRRLARRAGVKRINALVYETTRDVLRVFLENVLRDSVAYTEHSKRKTVTSEDIAHGLARHGITYYTGDDDFIIPKKKLKEQVQAEQAAADAAGAAHRAGYNRRADYDRARARDAAAAAAAAAADPGAPGAADAAVPEPKAGKKASKKKAGKQAAAADEALDAADIALDAAAVDADTPQARDDAADEALAAAALAKKAAEHAAKGPDPAVAAVAAEAAEQAADAATIAVDRAMDIDNDDDAMDVAGGAASPSGLTPLTDRASLADDDDVFDGGPLRDPSTISKGGVPAITAELKKLDNPYRNIVTLSEKALAMYTDLTRRLPATTSKATQKLAKAVRERLSFRYTSEVDNTRVEDDDDEKYFKGWGSIAVKGLGSTLKKEAGSMQLATARTTEKYDVELEDDSHLIVDKGDIIQYLRFQTARRMTVHRESGFKHGDVLVVWDHFTRDVDLEAYDLLRAAAGGTDRLPVFVCVISAISRSDGKGEVDKAAITEFREMTEALEICKLVQATEHSDRNAPYATDLEYVSFGDSDKQFLALVATPLDRLDLDKDLQAWYGETHSVSDKLPK